MRNAAMLTLHAQRRAAYTRDRIFTVPGTFLPRILPVRIRKRSQRSWRTGQSRGRVRITRVTGPKADGFAPIGGLVGSLKKRDALPQTIALEAIVVPVGMELICHPGGGLSERL